jgi:hypothetical protein
MLAVIGPERHATVTPSRESEGVTVACWVRLRVGAIAESDGTAPLQGPVARLRAARGSGVLLQALTAFWTSRASSNWPCSL